LSRVACTLPFEIWLGDEPMYEKTLYAGWGDMDSNRHMKNTAFLDKSADVRMMFFSDNGFPVSLVSA